MAIVCNCDDGVYGFGVANCTVEMQRAVGFGFQKTKNAGTYNAIDGSTTLTQALWEAELWASDTDARINLFRNVKNVTDERADPDMETIDGIDYVVSEGNRYISFEVIGVPPIYKSIAEGLNCGEYSVYTITPSEQLTGWKSGTDLRGVPIEKGTLYAKYIPATKTTKSRIMVRFMVAESFEDGEMGYIPSGDITADLLGTNSQIETVLSNGSATTTSVTFEADWYANGSTTAKPYVGATSADFAIYNNTTTSAVTITGLTESPNGTYTLTFALQTASDVLDIDPVDGQPITFTSLDGLVVT